VKAPKISLLFHSHLPYQRVRRLVCHALKLGYTSVWVNDTERGKPIEILSGLRRDFGRSVELGVAAINVCKWFNVEPQRLLAGVPSDASVALCVGDLRQRSVAGVGLGRLVDRLILFADTSRDMGFKTLLAAQGPRMLGLSNRFDGVVFGFLKPAPVSYAKRIVGDTEFYSTAPSLVYEDGYSEYAYRTLRSSAKYVYVGASEAVRRVFPNFEDYYLMGDVNKVKKLMVELGELGVRGAILAYPQTMNEALITQAYTLSR
jgi:hypothetical protein